MLRGRTHARPYSDASQLDFAFQKSENVGRGRITAPIEIVNAFDRPDFNGPIGNFGNPNFGGILDLSGFPHLFHFTVLRLVTLKETTHWNDTLVSLRLS